MNKNDIVKLNSQLNMLWYFQSLLESGRTVSDIYEILEDLVDKHTDALWEITNEQCS